MISSKIHAIHQIEITSRCNLRCKYCTHPTLGRAKMDIAPEDFERALYLAKLFVSRGTQKELNLCGIGESTMHPQFIEYMTMAREAIGWDCDLVLATNGLLVDDAMAEALVPLKPKIWVSLHRPEKAAHAVNALRRVGLLAGVSADPSLASVDWAGQLDWPVTAASAPCPWVRSGWGFVMADGRVSRCCFDATGEGTICHVRDLTTHETTPYSLCDKCHLKHPAS